MTRKMRDFLRLAAAAFDADRDIGYHCSGDKRQASTAASYGFGSVIDIGKRRHFFINQAGRDALAQQ